MVDGIAQDGPEVVSLPVGEMPYIGDESRDVVIIRVATGGVFTDQILFTCFTCDPSGTRLAQAVRAINRGSPQQEQKAGKQSDH